MAKQQIVKIDGVAYDLLVLDITRSFSVLDTDNTGRVIAKGRMHREIVGTFYNYTIRVSDRAHNRADYNAFFEAISAPVESHIIELPYAQRQYTFRGYVTTGSDNIRFVDENGVRWSAIEVNFIALEAARLP